MKFFTVYGMDGLRGIMIACTLFFLLGYIILKNAIKKQAESLRDILVPISGERLMNMFELFVHLFLAGSYYIMLSGSAAALKQGFGVPYTPAVILLGFVTVFWLRSGLKGLAEANTVMVPVMMVLTAIIFINLPKNTIGNVDAIFIHKGNYVFSAFNYVSYNMMTASMVLSSSGTYTKRQGCAFGASLLASIGLFFMATLMWSLTAAYYGTLKDVEIPLMWIAKKAGRTYSVAAVFILLFAMLTTAVGVGFAFMSSFSRKHRVSYTYALLCLVMGIPVAHIGFSRLISFVYPVFGIVGIIFVILVVARRFLNIYIE